MKRSAAVLLALLAWACQRPLPPPPGPVLTGLDVLERAAFAPLRGKRIGLITNQTGRDRFGRSTAEVLSRAPGVELAVLFSPEHGFAGSSEAIKVSDSVVRVAHRDLPVRSLYSGGMSGMRPNPEDLSGLDALVFDIQDIGTRAYTYLATMAMALEEAAKAGVEFVVLDRPNPITGTIVEGPVLDDLSLRKVTPTAYFPVPARHGLTAGEMARLHNEEVGHPGLTVVRMSGWRRDMWYDETGLPWTPPSPNMPDLEAAALYPGLVVFEASNLAVGRGTPVPFRWVGAPWLDSGAVMERLSGALLDGIEFSEQAFTPGKSVHAGRRCPGIRLRVTDRRILRPLSVFLTLHRAIRDAHPDEFRWRWDELKRLVGTDEFRRILERGGDPAKEAALFARGAEDFARRRRALLLYPEPRP